MVRDYTKEELARLHEFLYDILGEIDRICVKHGIRYFAIGGTAIGLLYDKAILPWDDDVDIGMTRSDYNKFLKIAEKELAPKYFLSWFGSDPHTPYYFAKVMNRNTTFVEKMCANIPMRSGIFVDIFPFDRIPSNKSLITIQRLAAEFLFCCLIGKEVWIWKHCKKPEIENPSNRSFIPCALTWLVDLIVPKKVIFRCFVSVQELFNSRHTTYYNNIMTKTDRISDTQLANLTRNAFGPITVYAPADVEGFLRYNYPTLHRFTPEEQAKVQGHYPHAMSFDNSKESNPH